LPWVYTRSGNFNEKPYAKNGNKLMLKKRMINKTEAYICAVKNSKGRWVQWGRLTTREQAIKWLKK
jgi:hypothetical protein